MASSLNTGALSQVSLFFNYNLK